MGTTEENDMEQLAYVYGNATSTHQFYTQTMSQAYAGGFVMEPNKKEPNQSNKKLLLLEEK